MLIDLHRPGSPRDVARRDVRHAHVAGALVVAIAMVLGLVAPALAAAGPTRLYDASVSPRSGSTSTVITFAVSYRNREGSQADYVRVRVAGATHTMTRTGGGDWKQGVRFTWSGKLPTGNHAVTFEAMSRDKFTDSLGSGTVKITAPEPKPAATPKPTPKPTAKPTAAPISEPTAAAGPATPGPTPTPVARVVPFPLWQLDPDADPSSAPDAPTGSAGPSPSADGMAVAPGSVDAGGAGGPGPGSGPAGGGPTAVGGPSAVGGAGPGGGQDVIGSLASTIAVLGGGRPELPLSLIATMTTTTGIVAAAMAFSLFGKRRRDGEQPESDEIMAHAAASGVGTTAATLVARPAVPGPMDLEMAMPRWRRPSLLEARKADPIRDAPQQAARLAFDKGLVGPLDGHERRLIRYNVVRMMDSPDELRGTEVGFLEQGDEVQLLEKYGVYWLVLCPDGRQGWIHKMTLGEVVEVSPPSSAATATMPLAADTWTMGDDVDGDVLAAYLESRRRT